MDQYISLDLTKTQVDIVRGSILDSIKSNRYVIKINREKNREFIEQYALTDSKIKLILKSIKTEHFVEARESNDVNNRGHILYIFVPTINLYNYLNEMCRVSIYIKIDYFNNGEYSVVISFHECEYEVNYAFN